MVEWRCPYVVCQVAVGSFVAGWGLQGVSVVDCGVQGQDAVVGLGEDGLAQGGLPWSRLRW